MYTDNNNKHIQTIKQYTNNKHVQTTNAQAIKGLHVTIVMRTDT